jgi:hypothetical protein
MFTPIWIAAMLYFDGALWVQMLALLLMIPIAIELRNSGTQKHTDALEDGQEQMYLYVWYGYLGGEDSIAVAYASNTEEAWNALKEKDQTAYDVLQRKCITPTKHSANVAFTVWND